MRFYRFLLHFFPASFRREYGEAMCALFAERLRNADGFLQVSSLWVETLFDIFPNALRVHWDIFRQDFAYTVRTMTRTPGFALTAILLAGLGIAATTATFSVADHVLLRPLPYAGADRLVKLWEASEGYRNEASPANFREWKQQSTSFEGMAAFWGISANLVAEGEPVRLDGAQISSDLFPLLGAQPMLGRVFSPGEDREGAPGTILLSHRLWAGRFGGDPGIVGRKVLFEGAPYVIIGVMPGNFYFPNRTVEFWTTLRISAENYADRGDHRLQLLARLKHGVSLEQARAEMSVVTAQLERAHPVGNKGVAALVWSLRDEVAPQSRQLLLVLTCAAICVLLIACTNLANLLLARALARRKELAVRTALGAGRERLVRQLLTESLMLAVCGGVLGVLLGMAAAPLMARLVPKSLPIAELPGMDLRILIFAVLLTLATGVGFGVLPALRAFGAATSGGLHEGSTEIGGRKERLRSALVVAEVTVSVVLLVSAGLLIRALRQVQQTDPGFRAEGVLTLRTALPMPKYEKVAQRRQFYSSVLADVRALPGVSSAGYTSFLPMVMRGGLRGVEIEGKPEDPDRPRFTSMRFVTPGYFAAMGVPLLQGRDISESDTHEAPFVAVVSESFVRDYLPGEDPIGRRIKYVGNDRTIVGVVGNIRVRGLETKSEPQVYISYQQVTDGGIIGYVPKDLVVRSSSEPSALLPAIRRIVARADPQQPISSVKTLAELVEAETAPRSTQLRVLGSFAAIAFLLAGIGIYGLLVFTVSSREKEIAVRMALGAQPQHILRMVMRQGLLLAAAGIFIGVLLANAAGRAMQALLAGVSPADPGTLLGAVFLALLMTMLGSFFPALRASRVDPMKIIRAE